MKNICIAGGSGFLGKELIQTLRSKPELSITATSRRKKTDNKLRWVQCDLFSLLDAEKALDGCDIGIYLVHSMLPSARLSQGSFQDFDLVIADNFARACNRKGVKNIIYISGIIPDNEPLSTHLESRLEVENCLAAYGSTVTTLRAGIILGPTGSSFTIMKNLVLRLPVMLCPKWTTTQSSPVYVGDVTRAIEHFIDNPPNESSSYDLVGSSTVTYLNMMKELSNILKKKRFFFTVPFFSPKLSKYWVSVVTGAPKNLVYPLIQSLKHKMVGRKEKILKLPGVKFKSLDESLQTIVADHSEEGPSAFAKISNDKNEVRSVQRLSPKKKMSALSVSKLYLFWLPIFMRPLIKVGQEGDLVKFYLPILNIPLLILEYSNERSIEERQLYYIRGGLLAYPEGRGRLEFRSVFDQKYTIAAIHEFNPRLPWFIYKYTQAKIHLFVMKAFDKFLREQYEYK